MINYPIKPQKEKAWHYKSHPYFTKQAENVVTAYIEHYSKEGDTVLDPFGGTGVTAIAALKLNRKAVIMDINPLSCFLIEQTCKKINISLFKEAFLNLLEEVAPQINEIYQLPDNQAYSGGGGDNWFPKNIKLPKNADFDYVHELYTPRQLLSYSLLFDRINRIVDTETKALMKYVFSSTMAKVNLTYMDNPNRGGEGGGSSVFGKYRYWKPKQTVELNVWKNFAKKFEYILKGKEKWHALTDGIDVNANLTVINGSALELNKHIAQGSIDYIYTDPPYGGNIAYLDLSTMWNAWLFPEIFEGVQKVESLKEQEVIEGGDLHKSQKEYEDLFAKSLEQMGYVLKEEGWLSCVFAHKKLEYWNLIIESCENNGLEFKGSVYQPTNNSSVHYKTNPANVLCSQRIANFKKTYVKSPREKPDNLKEFILNEIERTCMSNNGAHIDAIYQKVLDRLLQNQSLHEAKKKGYLNLNKLLDDTELFYFEESSGRYFVKKEEDGHKAFAQEFFRNKDELKLVLSEILLKLGSATIDMIHRELFEVYAEDKRFPLLKHEHEDIESLLPKIAYQNKKNGRWVLSMNRGEQTTLNFGETLSNKLIKIKTDGLTHSAIIFRLVKLADYLGFYSWIGKREQIADEFQSEKFSAISLPGIPNLNRLTSDQLDKIQQIDVIWFDKLGIPRYAFEVEETTSILSGLERFKFLLEYESGIANNLFIVAPHSRRKKLTKTFTNSSYIGHPMYMENKVRFIFKEDLAMFYDTHLDIEFSEQDMKVMFQTLKNSD